MQVLFRGGDAGVAKPLFHDLKIGSTEKKPRGVCMPQIMDSDPAQSGCLAGCIPHLMAEPVGGNMAVSVARTPCPRRVLSAGAACGTVDCVGPAAVLAPAFRRVVSSECAVAVPSALRVRLGQPRRW